MEKDIKLVVVSDKFYPITGNRSRRILERCRYLQQEKNVNVEVVTPQLSNDTKDFEDLDGIKIYRIKPFFNSIFPNFEYWNYNFKGIKKLIKPFAPLVGGYLRWIIPCRKKLIELSGPDKIIYTFNNPITLHLIGYLVRYRFKAWTAELRDPISNYEFSKRDSFKGLDKHFERLIIKYATIVFFRKGIQLSYDNFLKKHSSFSSKIIELPDYGVDLKDFHRNDATEFTKKEYYRGIFAGNFYGKANPVQLIECVEKFSLRNIFISFFGQDYQHNKNKMCYEFHGFVSYWQLVKEYKDCEFTVVFDITSDEEDSTFIPSKVSELIALQKPILVITNNVNSATSTLVRENNIGFIANNQQSEITNALKDLVEMIENDTFNYGYFESVKDTISNKNSEEGYYDILTRC